MAQASVRMFYQSVIDDVILNVREAFIDEGLDEQTLTELKQTWERKVIESKATEREIPVNRSIQPVQLQSSRVTPSFSDQLKTVASENMLAQTALHYTTQTGNESKPVATQNIPVKLNFTVPARLAQAGLHSLLATASGGGATMQIPQQQLTQLLQNSVLQAATRSNPVQPGAQQISGVQYQVLTAQQLQGTQQFTVAVPVAQPQKQPSTILQLDGANDDTSDEDEELSYSDPDEEEEAQDSAVDDDPLNSNDDESDEDPADVFDSDNVVVCQYDKIARSKNRWKFHLKDGIMNLHGKDYIFHKVMGDSEW